MSIGAKNVEGKITGTAAFWVVLVPIILVGMTQATVSRFGHSLSIDEP